MRVVVANYAKKVHTTCHRKLRRLAFHLSTTTLQVSNRGPNRGLGSQVDDFSWMEARARTTASSKGLPDVLALDRLIVLSKLCNTLVHGPVLLICFDCFVMHTTLVLCHKYVILFSLLLRFHLLVKGVYVILLCLLLLILNFAFKILHSNSILRDRLCI